MFKATNKSELGAIRTLANAENYARKAEKELSRNIGIKLSEEEYKRVFNINGIAIVTAKEDIQEIKERKIKELIARNKPMPPVSQEQINRTFVELENKSKVVSYWYSITKTSETTCQIIDKETKVILLETDIMIANRIIKATFEDSIKE